MGMGGARGYGAASPGGVYGPPRAGLGRGPYVHPGHPIYGRPGHYLYPGRFPYRSYYPWGWGYSYVGYPAWWGSYGDLGWNNSDSSQVVQPASSYAYPEAGSYLLYQQQEIDRLSDEVARLQTERTSTPQEYVRQQPRPQIQADTVLIFRDHHTEEIANYAVVGGTLWIFNEQRARKIPVSELDVPATTKANEDRGITFSLPSR